MNRPMFCVFCIDIHYHCSTLHASQSQAFSYNFKESMCFSFRWDFLYGQEENLASFRYLRRHGTFMPMVRPVFPPEDYPVWTSMATGSRLYLFAWCLLESAQHQFDLTLGKYPEDHNINGDIMFDLKTRRFFDRDDANSTHAPFWWQDAEPFWSTAAKYGKKVERTLVFKWTSPKPYIILII